jgi:hypothetical protein
MTNTELIVEAFREAGRPLTLGEVFDATGIEEQQKVRGLIYYLVNKERLLKAEPSPDGVSRWRHPTVAQDQGAPADPVNPAGILIPIGFKRKEPPQPTVASVMAASMNQEAMPHVCVNFGTGAMAISVGDDVIKVDGLAAAQHLYAQMEQAIAALGALDGR